jgi:serine/threonine-protein kinase
VYEAIDERLDRRVAVKVMSAALSADPAFSDRFSREARAAAKLTHINAVAVYDQGYDNTSGHHVFLVMELVEGRTLRDLIRERSGPFGPAEAITIMEPVLAALAAAHRAGIVHRDVKPENILLSDDGLVKVADFGLARAVDSDAASTRTGLMMGTVAYCAPEQIVHGQADQRSDVYAAGIVLFELLTGRTPYQGDSAMNVAYQHVHSRVPAPSSRVRGIPNEVDELVIAATDSEPSGRPADASAFLAEIAEVRADLDLPIVPLPARPRAPRPPLSSSLPNVGTLHGETNGAAPPLRPVEGATARTEFLAGASPRHDTQVVSATGPLTGPVAAPPAGPAGAAGFKGSGPRKPRGKQRTAKQRRRRRTIIGLVVVVLLGLASTIGGMKAVDWYHSWNTHVPRVANETKAQAERALADKGYKYRIGESQYSDTVPAGDVLSASPPAGSRLQRGKTVTIAISDGVHMVLVPQVAGLTFGAAQTTLTNAGLQFGPTPTQSSSLTVRRGRVISTDPAYGTSVRDGSAVTVVVSSGKPLETIPDIPLGENAGQAETQLTNAHFVVNESKQFDDSVAAGDVISVDPPSGQALYGSTVKVVVSKGPQYVQVPPITQGESSEDASAALKAVGLVPKLDTSLDGGAFDRVYAVRPGPGTSVVVGSTVVLVVV